MKHKKAAVVSLLFTFSFALLRFSEHSSPETDDRISHAYVGDDSIAIEKLKNGNTENIYDTSYYQSYYFSNLTKNFGNNAFGTCTYVSMGMLFSFFDTYYDNNFVPTQFEEHTEITAESTDDEPCVLSYETPGVKREPDSLVSGISADEYNSLVDTKEEDYFQFKLLSLAKQKFGKVKFESSADPFGMTYDEMIGFMEYYLYDYRGFEEPEVSIKTVSKDKSAIANFVENEIRNGNPVLLRTSDFGGHSFIVYDYDASSKEYYAHTGLSDPATGATFSHYRLGKLDSASLWDATSLSVNTMHSHTNHYRLVSKTKETEVCPCFYMKPWGISVTDDDYRDHGTPTFSWKSLIKDKWYYHYTPYFDVEILDSDKNRILRFPSLRTFSVTLTESQWRQVMTHEPDNIYYLRVQIRTSGLSLSDAWVDTKEFKKPRSFYTLLSIKPKQYGFEDAYPTDEKTKTEFMSHTAGSGAFRFETRRYRTGYIHNECLVMSPIRTGSNEAFLEYRFNTAISSMEVELSHWREVESEILTKDNGRAVIQSFKDSGWVDVLDLLSSSTNLKRDRNNMQVYTINFDRPTYRVRFYSKYYGTATNDSNKGRICIGNLKVVQTEYSMPLSGSELDYDPDYWNTKIVGVTNKGETIYLKKKTNCYSYALNAEKNPDARDYSPRNPGDVIVNNTRPVYDAPSRATVDQIKKDLKNDAKRFGFTLYEIDGSERCQEGTYKIACFLDLGHDYHFYRQNPDGTWSHKPGDTDVRNTDESGNIILNPLKANREMTTYNYATFVDFFAVSPLEN